MCKMGGKSFILIRNILCVSIFFFFNFISAFYELFKYFVNILNGVKKLTYYISLTTLTIYKIFYKNVYNFSIFLYYLSYMLLNYFQFSHSWR